MRKPIAALVGDPYIDRESLTADNIRARQPPCADGDLARHPIDGVMIVAGDFLVVGIDQLVPETLVRWGCVRISDHRCMRNGCARTRILGALADELRASDWATRSARKRIKELEHG